MKRRSFFKALCAAAAAGFIASTGVRALYADTALPEPPKTFKAVWMRESESDVRALYGMDAEDRLARAIAEELARDPEFLALLERARKEALG